MPECTPCDRWFNGWDAYYQHMRDSSRHVYCDICDRDFDSWYARRQHYINSPRHDFCRGCDQEFPDREALVEHRVEDHDYCVTHDMFFKNATGLHEHYRQSPDHPYCAACRRLFRSENNLGEHLRSSVHQPKDVPCVFRDRGCTEWFVSRSAMLQHLEAGRCASGVNREMVDRYIRLRDRGHVVTDPSRLLTDGDTTRRWIATERSWNGSAYECVLCHSLFRSLADLNRHLASPRHQDKIYRCPLTSCQARFPTLSGLCQHVESESCGVLRFQVAREGMDRLLGGMSRLRITGETEIGFRPP